MTRNCENSVTSRPGNRSLRCARMTLDKLTKLRPFGATLCGTAINRGSTRGTLTMAISLTRPNASAPFRRTMKLSDLLATIGNGCDGSSPTGISSGCTSRAKYSRTHLRCAGLRSPCDRIWMPFSANAGIRPSLYSAYWRSTSAWALAASASKLATVLVPRVSPVCAAVRCGAARTSKNSSRLDETIHR